MLPFLLRSPLFECAGFLAENLSNNFPSFSTFSSEKKRFSRSITQLHAASWFRRLVVAWFWPLNVFESGHVRRQNEMMRLLLSISIGVVIGFLIGVSSPKLAPGKRILMPSLFHSIDLTYIDDKHNGLLRNAFFNGFFLKGNQNNLSQNGRHNNTKICPPKKPNVTERLPPGIIVSESDFYLRRLLGKPHEDLKVKPKYLVTFTVGYNQKDNINKALQKFSQNFTVLLFHYDGRTSEWDEFEWSERAIHISVLKQTKWWYAKRFLHPDIVAAYDYIFIWDEDLGLENFDAEEYLKLVRKHKLEISQPGLEKIGNKYPTWRMTMKREDMEVHKVSREIDNWCRDLHVPPCAGFVEIMATVFSRDAWRCVWHMVQNDLVHGWGLDFSLRRCVEPAHEKIGVVDAQWIIHQGIPSLRNQGQAEGKLPAEAVKVRCYREWEMFTKRMNDAEAAYIQNGTS